MNSAITKRIGRIEDRRGRRVRPLSTPVIIENMDGTASCGGIEYPDLTKAKAANPSPSGDDIVAGVFDRSVADA
ncbi:MAG: hypothetical protein HQK81_06675 [Desulfovibrionaceae bacterium]|nr:hypothetical protein [Desulfovibrionaceae bacterium]MBF0513734.1 hypothetical protein [Desulfovibrionaceae bacterium]